MQVITRGVDEGLVIGDNVRVNVLEIQADHVRLAIIDSDSAPYYREVVLQLPSDDNDGDDFDPLAQSDYDFEFEDEDSRLIPMAR